VHVYCVRRKWFEKLDAAEAYRKAQGLKPVATTKISVSIRSDLCALLNALCEPLAAGTTRAMKAAEIVPVQVIDEAYIEPSIGELPDYVPRFLLDDEGKKIWDARHRKDRP
jgi:hypothetical protein